jgi:uncharacterized membrane protein
MQVISGGIRTVVPIVVGYLLGLAFVQQLGITEDQLTMAVSAVFTALYWLVIRIFEVYVSPKFSRLLGTKSSAVYVESDDAGIFDVTSLPKG